MIMAKQINFKYKDKKLDKTIKSIKNVGGNIAGVVLNKVPVEARKYEKSYYYGSQLTTTKEKRNTGLNKGNFGKNTNQNTNSKRPPIKEENIEKKPTITNNTENNSTEKTQEILRQVNEYLEQERNDTKRDQL